MQQETCHRRRHKHKVANINQPQAGEINRTTEEKFTACSRSLEGNKHQRSRRYIANTIVKHMWHSTSVFFYNPLIVVVSFWIFKNTSALVCPVSERLSRAPPAPPRPQDRATPAPHGGTTSYRRKNGPKHQTRRAGSVERSRLRSPIWREIVKTWKPQHDAATNCA